MAVAAARAVLIALARSGAPLLDRRRPTQVLAGVGTVTANRGVPAAMRVGLG
jgi:hypothetical protein